MVGDSLLNLPTLCRMVNIQYVVLIKKELTDKMSVPTLCLSPDNVALSKQKGRPMANNPTFKTTPKEMQTVEDGAVKTDLTPKSLTKQEFGKRLYSLMVERGWQQSDLARAAGIGRDSVSTYMRGHSLPGP